MKRPSTERDAYVAHYATVMRVLHGAGFEEEAEYDAERSRRTCERGVSAEGVVRQFAAVIASGDRTAALHSVQVPTLVVHGDADPLVHVACGIATAAAIFGAQLPRIPDMSHALPGKHWPRIFDAIAGHAARV